MASTYTWRATDGKYFSSSGSSSTIDNHVYYSSNRAFRMDYPDLGGLLGKDKRTLSIQSAILHVYITEAHSALLLAGMDRDAVLASLRGQFTNVSGAEAALREQDAPAEQHRGAQSDSNRFHGITHSSPVIWLLH